ncbi:SGNH/GDSL hydrolase family protein [Kytococcus sedentarius]|uniref:SGNH/GDSL hydrolase family protein n=1 Tax=Kytococcus sedentarius TaxID=1276 RepID=UPI0035BBA5FB
MTTFDVSTLPPRTTWVFTGDSITHGVHHTHGARSWVEHLHERIRCELGRLEDIVVNSGVSGWTTGDVLPAFDHLIGRFSPAVVSISLGTNDALAGEQGLTGFTGRLAGLVQRAQGLGATTVLHTPVLVLPDAPAARHDWLPTYGEEVRRIATASGALLVDHEQVWRAHFGGEAATPWMDDHTHPNAEGHLQMAQTTLSALGMGSMGERAPVPGS